MKVLVTGSNGFVGKHVCLALKKHDHDVLSFDLSNEATDLDKFIKEADFIIHLAGVNRPLTNEEFYDGNVNLTKKVVDLVKNSNKKIPILFSSSIQASLDNDYGKSKKMAEDFLFSSGLPVYVFRLNNVFGKWCRANYNSACATFCYNIAHNLEIQVRDPNYVVHFNYIDDIVNAFLDCVDGKIKASDTLLYVHPIHDCSLGKLSDLLYYFKKEVESDNHLPLIHDDFEYKLFKTFLDYLNDDKYPLNFASDNRGSFEELYKSEKYGQISENISFPGITKGGHYHTYKNEIFYTVKGKCDIKQRNIKNNDLIENVVNGDKPTLVNIIPHYTHSIENIGLCNSVTLMWINKIYNPETADTYREDV